MPEATITITGWVCLLCGHKWRKSSNAPPEKCARCHKRDWNGSRITWRGNRYTAQWSHQKKIRAAQARLNPATPEQITAGSSLRNAIVREVSRRDVVDLIRQQEYLGTLGSARYYYALYFRHAGVEYLAGATIFGNVAGTSVNMICGAEHKDEVITLIRGACEGGWPHRHSPSFMISRACKMVSRDHDKHIICAFCDPAAKEEGVIYKALSWHYLGWTTPPMLYHVGGKWQDSKNVIHGRNRDRAGRPEKRKGATIEDVNRWAEQARQAGKVVKGSGYEQYIQRVTPAEAREQYQDARKQRGTAKRKFVHFEGDRRTVKKLRKALKYPILPYED